MKVRNVFIYAAFFALPVVVCAQNNSSGVPQYSDPIAHIANDIGKITTSVQTLNERLKEFVDKFEKVGGSNFSEKQQRLVLGLELLVKSEQRLATLQKFQIELVEKQGVSRARLGQIDRDSLPQSIDRSVAFEGGTKTEEIRESRRNALQAERQSLQLLLTQINSNLAETNDSVREAQYMVQRLRRTFLPQIERELSEP